MRQSSLYGYSRAALGRAVREWGFQPEHGRRLWRYLYVDCAASAGEMEELPAELRERLAGDGALGLPGLARQSVADGGQTEKFLLRLEDGQQIETVLMRSRGRVTACVSTQAGCALACVFCATGQMGFARNLTAAEIVAQAVYVKRALAGAGDARDARLRNIVLMGMGEPLLNYGAVVGALEIMRDSGGLAIGHKRLTISTVGVVPGIVRLADEAQPYSLAVSLHAASADAREALVPATRTWPLPDLMEACRYYTRKLDQRIFIEWTMIAGVNDSVGEARSLAALLEGIPAHVNLIPLNATHEFAERPAGEVALTRFRAELEASGLPVTIRRRRGIDIAAGCGQLASNPRGGLRPTAGPASGAR